MGFLAGIFTGGMKPILWATLGMGLLMIVGLGILKNDLIKANRAVGAANGATTLANERITHLASENRAKDKTISDLIDGHKILTDALLDRDQTIERINAGKAQDAADLMEAMSHEENSLWGDQLIPSDIDGVLDRAERRARNGSDQGGARHDQDQGAGHPDTALPRS